MRNEAAERLMEADWLEADYDDCTLLMPLLREQLDAALATERRLTVADANRWLNQHSGVRMTPNDHAEWWEFLRANGYEPLDEPGEQRP